jgi:hypothetical protein
MIDAIRRFLTVRYNYANPLARQRAGGLVVINTIMLVTWSIYVIVFVVPGLLRGEIPAPTVIIPLITLPILGVFTYYFVQNGRLGLAIWLFLIVLYLVIVPFSVFSFNYNLPIFLLIPTVAAGVLLDRRNFMVMLLLLLGALFVRVNVQNGITETIILDPSQNAQFDFGLMLFAIALPAAFLYAFSGSTQRISAVSVDDIHHLRAIGTFAEIEEDEDSLLANALRVVQSELGYEVGQIFLVGEDGIAQRRIRLGIGLNELTSSPCYQSGQRQRHP